MLIETKCPECRDRSIDFYTGKCTKCGYILDKPPIRVAEQHVENIGARYQLQKLSLKTDDILIITPKEPLTSNEAKNLINIFQSSTNIPIYIVFINEDIKIESLNDEKLKNIGLKRIPKES